MREKSITLTPRSSTPEEMRAWLRHLFGGVEKRCELLNGDSVRAPLASWLHGIIGARLVSLLAQHISERRLGFVVDASAGYDLPTGDTVVPDVSFITTERWSAGPMPRPDELFSIVPTLVVEIQSPHTVHRDRVEKRKIYEASGVDEYWLVDPELRCTDVLILHDGRYQRPRSYRSRLHSKVLPDLVITLEDLFQLPG